VSGFDYGALLIRTNGDLELARVTIEEALKRPGRYVPAPTNAERAAALENLGELAVGRGDFASARSALLESQRLDPANAEILYRLAAAERKAGNAVACVGYVDQAFKSSPQTATRDDYLVAAWALNRTGKPDAAVALLRTGIAAMPNASGLHLSLGYSLATQSLPVEALLEYWYEFENDAATDPYAKEARIQFNDGLGRAQAIPKYTADILLLRSAVVDQAGDPTVVLADLAKLEADGYKHPALDLLRAETLYVKGDTQAAETALRALLASDPAFLPTYLDLALILRGSDRDEEARRLVGEAARRNPSHWQLIGEPAPLSLTAPAGG
jgi:tetratricopeptide (TPR) repeat protein